MAVFVDDARIPWRGMRWSHMVAETSEELHRAAAALGIDRERAQAKGRTLHYDLPDHGVSSRSSAALPARSRRASS